MTQPHTEIPVRAPAQTTADDTVQPFEVSALDLRGRVVPVSYTHLTLPTILRV